MLLPLLDSPVVEYDTPAPNVAHQVHAVPAPLDEYDAPAESATPSPSMDGLVVKVVHDSQLQVVEKAIEIPQLQAIEETSIFQKYRLLNTLRIWIMLLISK